MSRNADKFTYYLKTPSIYQCNISYAPARESVLVHCKQQGMLLTGTRFSCQMLSR